MLLYSPSIYWWHRFLTKFDKMLLFQNAILLIHYDLNWLKIGSNASPIYRKKVRQNECVHKDPLVLRILTGILTHYFCFPPILHRVFPINLSVSGLYPPVIIFLIIRIYIEIPLLRPPKIKTSYLLKTLFAKFKLFFSSFSTPSVHLIRDHLWDCPKVVFKTTFGQSKRWS